MSTQRRRAAPREKKRKVESTPFGQKENETSTVQTETATSYIAEIAQRIVDIEETSHTRSENTGIDELAKKLKEEMLKKHIFPNTLISDTRAVINEISTLFETYNNNPKASKDRIVKKVTAKKIELVVASIVAYNRRKKEGTAKERAEIAKKIKDLLKDVINCIGGLLELSKSTLVYYPFIFYLLKQLVSLASEFRCFIPMAYYPMYMLNQMMKTSQSNTPALPVSEDHIRVPESYIHSKLFREYVFSNGLDLILSNLQLYSNSVSFPEYSSFISTELKGMKNPEIKHPGWISTKIEAIIKAIETHSDKVSKLRAGLLSAEEEAVEKIEAQIPLFTI